MIYCQHSLHMQEVVCPLYSWWKVQDMGVHVKDLKLTLFLLSTVPTKLKYCINRFFCLLGATELSHKHNIDLLS